MSPDVDPRALLEHLRGQKDALADLVIDLARIESPSTEPTAAIPAFDLLAKRLSEVGFTSRQHPEAGLLLSRPAQRRCAPYQMLVGHMDTVWPVGTTAHMPITVQDDRIAGPGVYDMKGGLASAVFALAALWTFEVTPSVDPVLVVNTDEEIGSRRSVRHIARLARSADRALVLEPSLGLDGRLKTARKGLGRFRIRVHGRAAHAGLDPGAGASAILELSHQIQSLFALNDPVHGISVNVGMIDGGIRPNVIAPVAEAIVDVRVPTIADGQRIEAAIHNLAPVTPGTQLQIEGSIGKPPMERNEGTVRLWEIARDLGESLGLSLQEGTAGGGSDGNTTSQFTPTLDGLGAVGDGAHAPNEHLVLDALVERTALLALLLLTPPLHPSEGDHER